MALDAVPGGENVLDLGGGPGDLAALLVEKVVPGHAGSTATQPPVRCRAWSSCGTT
ncbi:MAG: hypothetical protein AB2L07_01460 [Thermoanaerobaculaceae bacterium]